MTARDPERNFELLWRTFHNAYPFFELRNVDWNKQYDTYRPRVTKRTADGELFDILCAMLAPLNDGHVELEAKIGRARTTRYFTAEKKPRFHREFTARQIQQLFAISANTLVRRGFEKPRPTAAWMLHYCRSAEFAYMRLLELEGVRKRTLTASLDAIARDFASLKGIIIDIRDNPGGEDDIAIAIVNRFCDRRRVAFRRKTKIGPGKADFTPLRTWHLNPEGPLQFTGPIVVLTCDAVFSGAEAFVLAIRNLPYVTIVGDHTNGIFSYQLEKKLANGWDYCLSHQVYFSPDMVCYEGSGIPPEIKLLNKKSDLAGGIDPLIVRAINVLKSS
jgi:carboxyl-terminal processing protease